MKRRTRFGVILLAACLALSGCQSSRTRTVVIQQRPEASQSGTGAEDGTLKEIHSFSMLSTQNGKTVQMNILGWLDETHLWCEMRDSAGKVLFHSVDDSYGFLKSFADTQHSQFLGVSPDGRYAMYLNGITEKPVVAPSTDSMKTMEMTMDLMVYDSKSETASQLFPLTGYNITTPQSFCFSQDGRYMAFFYESYDTNIYQTIISVYDFQSRELKQFSYFNYSGVYALRFQLTEVDSPDQMKGWLFVQDKRYSGLGNALYLYLEDGKAIPAESTGEQTGRISNIMSSGKELIRSKGLQLNQQMSTGGQDYYFYGNTALLHTMSDSLLSFDLRTGSVTTLCENADWVIVSPDGKKVAFTVVTKSGVEIYTARIAQDASQTLILQNQRLVYTGKQAVLKFWNQNGSKLVVYDDDEKDGTPNCRVLTFYTAQ